MTTSGVLAYLAGVGVTIAVAVPLRRALQRGSSRTNAIATTIVLGILAIALAVVLLN